MLRQIIKIDENACNGCGLCITACHENALALVDGKAKLLRDDYCDGLGNCLPACPTGAITFENREAEEFNGTGFVKGCPGMEVKSSSLKQWPVQISLVPVRAPFFKDADVLIAADCTAYSFAGFHERFMDGKVTLIGCPKLDDADYSEKLTAILKMNDIKSLTVVRMEVPCCGGIAYAADTALDKSGKNIPFEVVTLSTDGRIK